MRSSGLIGLFDRHRLLVLAFAALGISVAVCLALFVVTPTYLATVKLYVSGTGRTAADRLQNGEYARTHVASYADLIDSNDVLAAVRENVGLPQSPDGSHRDLADSVSASNPLGTVIVDVTVEDSSPERAQAVAAAIGEVYDSMVARLESPSVGSQSPVRISVVSPPALPTTQDSPNWKLYAAAGLLAGTVVGAGVAWLLEVRAAKRRRQSPGDQEDGDFWSWWPKGANAPDAPEATESAEVLEGYKVVAHNGNGAGQVRKLESGPADS